MNTIEGKRDRSRRGRPCHLLTIPVVLCAIAVCATGCLHFEQEIVIRPDGSGHVALVYAVDHAYVQPCKTAHTVIQTWQGEGTGGGALSPRWMFNKQRAEQHFNRKTTTLDAYTITAGKNRRRVEIHCEAEDVCKALQSGMFGRFAVNTEKGTTTLRMVTVDDATKRDISKQEREKLIELAGDLRMHIAVRTPAPIVETTGKQHGKHIAVWEFEVREDPAFLLETPDVHVAYRASPDHE